MGNNRTDGCELLVTEVTLLVIGKTTGRSFAAVL